MLLLPTKKKKLLFPNQTFIIIYLQKFESMILLKEEELLVISFLMNIKTLKKVLLFTSSKISLLSPEDKRNISNDSNWPNLFSVLFSDLNSYFFPFLNFMTVD